MLTKRIKEGSGESMRKVGTKGAPTKNNLLDLQKPRRKIMASAAWTRKEGKSKSGGLNAKGVASYRAANPGSKLKTAVTTKPSKLKKVLKTLNVELRSARV